MAASRKRLVAKAWAKRCCVLAEVPLHLDIRVAADGGAPIAVTKPDSPQAQAFGDVARKLVEEGLA